MTTSSQPLVDDFRLAPVAEDTFGPGRQLAPVLSEEEHRANAEFLTSAYALNTSITYRSQLRAWVSWCEQRGLAFHQADSDLLVSYLRERAGGIHIGERYCRPAKPNSLRVACAAISKAYETAGLADITKAPQVRDALRSHRNSSAQAGVTVRQAGALTADVMAAIRATAQQPRRGRGGIMETKSYARRRGLVDIALISLMRDCLLRRSEAAAVRWNHISHDTDGTGRLYIGVSKTDQEGKGALLFISRQTMRDLQAIPPANGGDRRVFGLHPRTIGKRIESVARAAGMPGAFSGHSARVGMARDLARAGEELPALMTAGRWQSSEMVARYIKHESAGRGAVARFHREG